MAIWICVKLIDAAGCKGFKVLFPISMMISFRVFPSYLQCFIMIMWFIQFTGFDFLSAGLLATWKESGGLPTIIVQELFPFLQVSSFTHTHTHTHI